MRNAAQAWEEDFAGKLESIGFVRVKYAPALFFGKRQDVGALYTATISHSSATMTQEGKSRRTWRAGTI